ncbi:hypothetical protein JW868_01160 [Candidatus Woesearchaeota archaeon]|nr:hypothetical protein [Candidatus Woesearchaeota archaeon]
MVAHLTEEHLTRICPVCKKPHGSHWHECFDMREHYVVTNCENCGHEVSIKSNTITSGIDDME